MEKQYLSEKGISEDPSESNVIISLPLNILYTALVDYLQENVRGQIIKVDKENGKTTNYAEILDVSFEYSNEENYDLVFDIKIRTLTTVFKNKVARIILHASIDFDKNEQVVTVRNYKLNAISNSWLMDNSLEAMANKLMYSKLKKKMKFEIRPEIEKQVLELNEKLENAFEVKEGINLFGRIESFTIGKIIPKPQHFLVLVNLKASAVIDINKILVSKTSGNKGDIPSV